jgi:hypothetical protein
LGAGEGAGFGPLSFTFLKIDVAALLSDDRIVLCWLGYAEDEFIVVFDLAVLILVAAERVVVIDRVEATDRLALLADVDDLTERADAAVCVERADLAVLVDRTDFEELTERSRDDSEK